MQRRTVLSGGVAAVGLAAAWRPAGASPVDTAPASALAARLRSGPALLDAFIRMRGRTDGKLVHGWLRSQRSAVIDGEVTPLCGVLAGAVQRFERRSEDLFEATILEVAHYTHPATGELLESVTMPGTGRSVRVPAYRFGPVKARFAVALDEWEDFDPPQGGSGAAAFVPRSSVHLLRSLEPVASYGDHITLRANEYGRVHPERSAPPTIYYREWMVWKALASELAREGAPGIHADYAYTALTSWRPWMQMGDLRGHTIDSGTGAKAFDWSACPPEFLELTRRLHPDVLDDPERALRAAPT